MSTSRLNETRKTERAVHTRYKSIRLLRHKSFKMIVKHFQALTVLQYSRVYLLYHLPVLDVATLIF